MQQQGQMCEANECSVWKGCLLTVCVACSVVCRRATHGVRLCVLPALVMPLAHPLFLLSALHVGALQGNKEPAKIISARFLDKVGFCSIDRIPLLTHKIVCRRVTWVTTGSFITNILFFQLQNDNCMSLNKKIKYFLLAHRDSFTL
jgi:hypothetical protein